MKHIKVNLFWKFSLAIIFIVTVFGSINAYLIWRNVQIALEEESEKRGLYISRHLAEEILNPLLYEDYVAMQRILETAVASDSSLDYAFVVNENGRVLTHTFEKAVPAALVNGKFWRHSTQMREQLFQPAGEPRRIIRDIAAPLMEGNLGALRIGMREENIRSNVRQTVNTFWLMAALFLAIGIAGAFVFSHFITEPIHEIERLTNQMDFNALEERSLPRVSIRNKFIGRIKLLFRAEDEIDYLADNFNAMIERLEDAYVDVQAAQQKLFQSEKMAVVGTVASGLAHEINNPLAGIQNCLRRIEKEPENIKQNIKYLTLMAEASDRIERVVRGMLEFARKQDYHFQEIDLADILEKAMMLVSYRLESSRISVQKELPPNLPPVWGSANHLEQVLVNLMINAMDSIDEHCRAAKPCERRLQFRIQVLKNHITLHVTDSGKGIPEDQAARIFDPFFTTKQIGKGTGLGLAVSLNIIQAHNGQIEVRSKQGRGATFTITLPISHSSAEPKIG